MVIFQVQGTFKLQKLGLKGNTHAIVVVKKIDHQVELRTSVTEIFMSNQVKRFKPTHFSTRALQMLHK